LNTAYLGQAGYDYIRNSDWVTRLNKLQIAQLLMFGIYEEAPPDS